MLEEMKSNRQGQPQLPERVPPALLSFERMQFGDKDIWRQIDFPSVYNYLRKSRKLRIPEEWQRYIPNEL